MPKQDALIFVVIDIIKNKIVFEGTAKDISEKYGLKYPNVYRYCDLEYAFRGRYIFKIKETYRRLIRGLNIETGEYFIGDVYENAEIFPVSFQYILRAANRNSICYGKYKFDFLKEGE